MFIDKINFLGRLEVHTPVLMKINVFWDMTMFSLVPINNVLEEFVASIFKVQAVQEE
jgi:hypothetical protein